MILTLIDLKPTKKMVNKKEIAKKTIFLVAIIFFLTMTLWIVKAAEQEGCCLDTGKGQQCVQTLKTECDGRFFTGPPYDCSNIEECKTQVCIPKQKDLACLRNKQVAECLAMDGVPDPKQLEEIPQCKPGCCIISNGVKAEVLQFRQCENLTLALGYKLEDINFLDNTTSQIDCKKQGSPSDLGCCVVGDGSCTYGPRENCEQNFLPLAGGLYCRDVAQCALTSHNYFDCGKLAGTETDIYWYDSQGNQEELYDNPDTSDIDGNCDYPEAICQKSKTVAYCKSTTCEVEGTSQEMSSASPKVTQKKVKETLLTGTSICYNFYTTYGDSRMNDRSTGLQNQVLHCGFGKIEIEGLGQDRQKLCFPSNASSQGPLAAYHANVVDNKWQNCSQCGNGRLLGEAGNQLGDFLGPAWIGFPTGRMWASALGGYCNKEMCEGSARAKGFGLCTYHQDLSAIGFGTPVGSCDPRYPPGLTQSQCTQCGGGGDATWNLCTRAECYSKGDCSFKPASGWLKAGTFAWYLVGMSISERVGQIIPECIATPIYCATLGKSEPACLHPSNLNVLSCLGDRGKNYALGAPIWLLASGGLKWAFDAASGAITSKITGSIGEAITNGISGSQKEETKKADPAVVPPVAPTPGTG